MATLFKRPNMLCLEGQLFFLARDISRRIYNAGNFSHYRNTLTVELLYECLKSSQYLYCLFWQIKP